MTFTPAPYCDAWRYRAGLPQATGAATCGDCPHQADGCPFAGCDPGEIRADAMTGGPAGRPAIPLAALEVICAEERRRAGLTPAASEENCLACLAFLPCEKQQRAAAHDEGGTDD